ncbi:16S rRNA (guanine(527)-N(7))-methyltransferase RsmG [Phenylobacterium sp.]|jgi:16S rRNA (guanine527-N7)-methyltransferase|uniref:16S rRNA (guanine(527)-N(7))-methyltransferase RsmG n=1 Tax=Phenylobacterium sp. TaxID=1871053 RepID=UPI002F4220A5
MSVAAPLEAAVAVTDASSFAAASGASAAQMEMLDAYRRRLVEWSAKVNLVGPATLDIFWSRHAWDSAQLLPFAPDARSWADLGAGAGLPGVVLAVLGKGRPDFHVDLIDSQAKRCRFLQAVVDELELPATVRNARAEGLSLKVEVAAARACAPLVRLLGYAEPYLRRGATGLFLKGQDVASELEEATRYWDFDADILQSRSDARGRIVRVRRLRRARKA